MGAYIIDSYIDRIEITSEGILIEFQLKKDELIGWEDERIKKFIPRLEQTTHQ